MNEFNVRFTSGLETGKLFTDNIGWERLNHCSKRKLFGKNKRYEIPLFTYKTVNGKKGWVENGTLWLFKKHIVSILVK